MVYVNSEINVGIITTKFQKIVQVLVNIKVNRKYKKNKLKNVDIVITNGQPLQL